MGKPDVSMAGNGLLAGLVAICSGIGEMSVTGTLITGAVAGVIVVVAALTVERIGMFTLSLSHFFFSSRAPPLEEPTKDKGISV